MNLHAQFKSAVLNEIKAYLNKNFVTLDAIPKSVAVETKHLASNIKKSSSAMQLRTYLVDYIALASPFWRKIAPYTNFNKLLTHLEKIVDLPEYSAQSIQMAQITSVHEHYLERQKELIEPLQVKIYSLQTTCQLLQKTVTSLREENTRLRIENDFFTQEIIALHERFGEPTIDHNPQDLSSKEKNYSNSLKETRPETEITLLPAP